MTLSTNTLGILYANITYSEDVKNSLGVWLVGQRVAQMISVISEAIHKHGGIVSNTFDDAVLGTFTNADSTFKTATEIISLQVDALDTTQTEIPLDLRIALNYGKMYVAAGNISGNEINLVLQLVKKADVGQVIATSALVEALSDDLKSHTSNIGVVRLESINEDVDIYNVSLDITSDTDRELAIKTVVIPPPVKKKKKQKVQPVGKKKILSIEYNGEKFKLDESLSQLTFGRGKDNNVNIFLPFVSKNHASIKYQDGRFVLINNSANGTFIRTSDSVEDTKCTTEWVIVGSGKISFGCPTEAVKNTLVHFSL